MTEATRYDVVPIKAVLDPDTGYLTDTPILTRTGIFEYKRADGTIQREYRPPSAVFHADHLASLKGKPIVEGHPGMVTSKTARQHMIGTVLGPGRQDGDTTMVADIILHDPSAVTDRGMRELSLGYRIVLDETPGEINGERYDAVQTSILCNHLGVVAKGRAGVARFNLDSADVNHTQEAPLAEDRLVGVRLDNIDYKASPEVSVALDRARADAAAAVARADAAQAAADSATARHDSAVAQHAAELAQVRADALATVRARMDMEAKAGAMGVTFADGVSDHDLRVAVIRHVRGDALDLSGKSADYVAAAYDMALADGVKRTDSVAEQRRQSAPNPAAVRGDADPYAAHVARLTTAWKGAA